MNNEGFQAHEQKTIRNIVISCSGSCPIGELCDKIARRLHKDEKAQMLGLSQMISNISHASSLVTADSILVIEGCHLGCLRDSLDSLGYDQDEYCLLDLSQIGFEPMKKPTGLDFVQGYAEARKLLARIEV